MAIAIECQSCKRKLSAPDSYAGTLGTCPNCKAPVAFPGSQPLPVIHPTNYFTPTPHRSRRIVVSFNVPFNEMVTVAVKWMAACWVAVMIYTIPFAVLMLLLMTLLTAVARLR